MVIHSNLSGGKVGLALGFVMAAAGCERVVDANLTNGPTRLVVEARIEAIDGDASGTQVIRLTTTDSFTSTATAPPARNAAVSVSDNHGNSHSFLEADTAPGVYLSSGLVATPGTIYTLDIDYQGDHYQATAELVEVAPIDSLYFRYEDRDDFPGGPGYRAAIDYTDQADVVNFYLWEQLVDGRQQREADPRNQFRLIAKDDFFDGQRITDWEPFIWSAIEAGQEVVVRQIGINEATYRYYYALFDHVSGSQGSPFGTPPSSLRGNVANLTNPDLFPLGYFWAAQVSEARAVLQASPASGPERAR